MNTHLFCKAFLIAVITNLSIAATAQQMIKVDASIIENPITPYMYGLCLEDVNHEVYGGLYNQRIFGESFEEPRPDGLGVGFSRYEGKWIIRDNAIHVDHWNGAKYVYDPISIADGTVEVELKFHYARENGETAGLLIRTANQGNGADALDGYQISLSGDGKKVLIGRHCQNWTLLTENKVDIDPTDWNILKVKMAGTNMKVFINDIQYLDYTDTDAGALTSKGKIALRTNNIGVTFRNLKITEKKGKYKAVPFVEEKVVNVSRMWDVIASETATVVFTLIDDDAYNTKHSQEVNFQSGSGVAGVANLGLNKWGIAVKKDQKFEGSLFLKGKTKGKIKIALQSADGQKEYATTEIDAITDDWVKHEFELTSDSTDENSRLAIYIDDYGKFRVDMVTLMGTGNDLFRGLPLRNDIARAMVDQGLTFLRYGGAMANADDYLFKNMIGPREDRPIYKGYWYDCSTNGFGIEEYLQLCEEAGFEACFSVNVKESAQDMADMIEYLKGDVTSTWGKKRAENGHPEPYKLNYIGIGNEEVIWGDNKADYQTYIQQFNKIYDAIREKDADIKFVNAAWWRRESPENMKMVFDALNGKAEYWDYHPWSDELHQGVDIYDDLVDMQAQFRQWDPNTTMKCAIFELNGKIHNHKRALSNAATLNAARRMGDFVFAVAAANALQPYLQNDNGWDQGQIFFTSHQAWGMPPYYVHKMSAANHKPYRVSSEAPDSLDVVAATDDNREEVMIYVINKNCDEVPAIVNVIGTDKTKEVKTYTLSASSLEAVNTPSEPEMIVPVMNVLNNTGEIKHTFPAYSYTIMVFKNRN